MTLPNMPAGKPDVQVSRLPYLRLALRSRIADRSSPRPLWPVIAPRSALRTSAAEERPAIAWLFVVGNVQFRGEPQIADTPKIVSNIKPVPRKSGLRRRDFSFST